MKKGFTLIELLIVISILAILVITGATTYGLQHQRGLDARRKSDLAKLKVSFEDYYNDKGCYPTVTMMSHCNQNDLQPYMEKVPCDPGTGLPYGYIVDVGCRYYGVFTTLQDTHDPGIAQINCSPTCNSATGYNYGTTNGGIDLSTLAGQVSLPTGSPAPTPTTTPTTQPTSTPASTMGPTPIPTPADSGYGCDPSGICNFYSDPNGSRCPQVYASVPECQAACSNIANRCAQ